MTEFSDDLNNRELLKVLTEMRHGNFSVRMPIDRLGLSVIPSLVRQLFYNLLNNAIKFRKKTVTPVIDISYEIAGSQNLDSLPEIDRNITFCHIAMSDNGIGFDPKYAGEIFGVFKRLHSYHEFAGTGVGLSICKKIMEKHNGFINAQSVPQEGSVFLIGIPVNTDEILIKKTASEQDDSQE